MDKGILKVIFLVLGIIGVILLLTACEPSKKSAGQKQAEATQKMEAEAERQIGMPDISNFAERKQAKMILELRDKAVPTYTYVIDMNGQKHFICESIGFGLPYSVQFTNPEKIAYKGHNTGVIALPQADPNGLYMPDGLSATWVLCGDKDGNVQPVYVEPAIMVSPFKMH